MTDNYTRRLVPGLRDRLSRRAMREHLPERTLAQRYIEEGLRHDAHPLIHFVDGPSGRRASLIGRGPDVWDVIATVSDGGGAPGDAAEYPGVPLGLVQAAVSYDGEFRSEVDDEISHNEAECAGGVAAARAGERLIQA